MLGHLERSGADDHFLTSYQLTELKTRLARIGLKHITVHLDCCHAGGIFLQSRSRKTAYRVAKMATHPAVQAVTAVTADEEALALQLVHRRARVGEVDVVQGAQDGDRDGFPMYRGVVSL